VTGFQSRRVEVKYLDCGTATSRDRPLGKSKNREKKIDVRTALKRYTLKNGQLNEKDEEEKASRIPPFVIQYGSGQSAKEGAGELINPISQSDAKEGKE